MLEIINNFHFARPYYFLLFIVIAGVLFFLRKFQKLEKISINYQKYKALAFLENLKYLVKFKYNHTKKYSLLLIFIFLALIILTLAKPRWKYTERELSIVSNNIIMLLDSSSSMNVRDIAPDRFSFSKAKINYLLNNLKESRVALVAFTETPHIIAPLTRDYSSIKQNLENLSTADFSKQGTDINEAINLSSNLYKDFSGEHNYIIVFSDGDFSDQISAKITKISKEFNIKFFIIQIGTKIGGPVYHQDKILTYQGQNIYSKANQKKLNEIANLLSATFVKATQSDNDLKEIINILNRANNQEKVKEKAKIWEEGFYIFLLPALFILLYYLRYMLSILLIFTLLQNQAKANIFLNQNQKAEKNFIQKNYQDSYENFTEPYNKGVAAYKNQNYQKAIEEFKKNKEYELKQNFNLANSYFMIEDYEAAIKEYKKILKHNSQHKETLHNLKLAKEKLQEQNNKQQNDKQENNQENTNNEKQSQSNLPNKHQEQNSQNTSSKAQNKENIDPNNEQQKKSSDEENSKKQEANNNNLESHEKSFEDIENIDNYSNILNLIENSAGKIMQHKIKLKEQNTKSNNQRDPW